MKRYALPCLLMVASVLLGWHILTRSSDAFMVYVFFGGTILLAVFAMMDQKRNPSKESKNAREREIAK